jgi:hypothetical protein
MKVNEYISLNFMAHFIYDDDVLIKETDSDGNEISRLAGLQIMQTLGIGLSYKF